MYEQWLGEFKNYLVPSKQSQKRKLRRQMLKVNREIVHAEEAYQNAWSLHSRISWKKALRHLSNEKQKLEMKVST